MGLFDDSESTDLTISPSKVLDDKGNSTNYTGRTGLTDQDKNYFETLLQNAMGALPKPRGVQKQDPNPVVGNYSGSMVGNVPIFASHGVDYGGFIDTVDDLFRQQQAQKRQMLAQDVIKVTQLTKGAFNQDFNEIFKGVIDSDLAKYTAYYKDPFIARKALTSSGEFKMKLANFDNFARDFNRTVDMIAKTQEAVNRGDYVPQQVLDKMTGFLANVDAIKTKYAIKDAKGNIIGMNLDELNKDMQGIQAYPAINKVATELTKDIESKVTQMRMAGQKGDQIIFDKEIWMNTYDPSNEGVYSKNVDNLVKLAMRGNYGQIIGTADDQETRDMLRLAIDSKIKKARETAIELKDGGEKEKVKAIQEIGAGQGISGSVTLTNHITGISANLKAYDMYTMKNDKDHTYDLTRPLASNDRGFYSETVGAMIRVTPGANQFNLSTVFTTDLDSDTNQELGMIGPQGTGVVGKQRLAQGVILAKDAGSYSDTFYNRAGPDAKNAVKGQLQEANTKGEKYNGVWVEVLRDGKWEMEFIKGDVSFTVPASNVRDKIASQLMGWEQDHQREADALYGVQVKRSDTRQVKNPTKEEVKQAEKDRVSKIFQLPSLGDANNTQQQQQSVITLDPHEGMVYDALEMKWVPK